MCFAAAKATTLLNLLYQNIFACAFRSHVIPILEYASQVWNPSTQKNIMKLEAVQLRAARWVAGSHFNRHTFK